MQCCTFGGDDKEAVVQPQEAPPVLVRNPLAVAGAVGGGGQSRAVNVTKKEKSEEFETPQKDIEPEPSPDVWKNETETGASPEEPEPSPESSPPKSDPYVEKVAAEPVSLFAARLKREAGESWGMDLDISKSTRSVLIVSVAANGAVERYNRENPNQLLEAGDWITHINGVAAMANGNPMELFSKSYTLELDVRKKFSMDSTSKNHVTDPKYQISPAASPTPSPRTGVPSEYTIVVTKSGSEKWGIDIDYGNETRLRVVGISESGAVYRYNQENPLRMLEPEDVIVEANGENSRATKMAMVLAQPANNSLRLAVKKPPRN